MRRPLAIAVVCATGCSNLLGIHDPSLRNDASVGVADAAIGPIDAAIPDAHYDAHPDAFVPQACAITITPRPKMRDLPKPVLNAADDLDATPGMQITVVVSSTVTPAALNGQLFIDGTGQGSMPLNPVSGGIGNANVWSATLTDGDHEVFARCTDVGGNQNESTHQSFTVDTTPPTCAFASPTAGAIVSPATDSDPSTQTIDLVVSATIGGGDTDGETATLGIGSATSTNTISGGAAQLTGAVTTDGPVTLTIAATDQAGNPCSASETVTVDYGCDVYDVISGAVPLAPDGPTGQMLGSLTVGTASACAGDSLTYSCNVGGASTSTATTVPLQTGGFPSDRVDACTVQVTDAMGVTTTSPLLVQLDGLGDVVVAPETPFACGSTITGASDVDPATPGVQIPVDVLAASGATPSLTVNGTSAGTPSGATFTVTLTSGANNLIGTAGGSTSATCTITLGGTAIAITGPADGAELGQTAGVVDGTTGALDTVVTGWVSDPTQPVTISVDGTIVGSPHVYADGRFSLPVSLSEGSHTIIASSGTGTSTVRVDVDVTAPDPVVDFVATRADRRHLNLTWTAPANTTCTIRQTTGSTTFDGTTATIIDAAGSTSPTLLGPIRLDSYAFQLKCADAAANVVTANASAVLDFQTLTAFSISPFGGGGGAVFASGDLDGDGHPDIVVNDGNELDVYWGSAAHTYATSPDLIIQDLNDPNFPAAAAIMDYDHDGTNDLVVGAPTDGNDGAAYVLLHAHFVSRPVTINLPGDITAADTAFTVLPGTTDTFWRLGNGPYGPGDNVGSSLVPIDFDGDGVEDLVLGAAGANSARGGGVVIFGHPSGAVVFANTPVTSFRIRSAGGKAITAFANLGLLGDVVGDTREDLAGFGNSGGGSTNVYYGRAAPTTGATVDITTQSTTVSGGGGGTNVEGSIEDEDANGFREVIIDGGFGNTQVRGVQVGLPYTTTLAANWCAGDSKGGDEDGDGHDDLVCVTTSNRLGVFWGPIPNNQFNAAPGFNSAVSLTGGGQFITWTPDLDGDGLPDIAVGTGTNFTIFY
jgi:hypothetical protein